MAKRVLSEFTSQNGTHYLVELHDEQFTGNAFVNNALSENGFDLVYGDNDSERYDPIRGSRLVINYLITNNQQQQVLLDIVNSPEKRFQLVVYRNDVFYWCGQITPDLIQIEDRDFPYYSQVTATDMLASLDEEMTGILPPTFFAINFKTQLEALMMALEYTGLNKFWNSDSSYLKTAVHWYPQNAGEFDTANAHAVRVLADGGELPVTTVQLRAIITAMRAVPLNDTFSALVQAHRARVLADGGTMPGTDAQILAAYPDSVELREGTPGLDGYDPLGATSFNLLALWDGFANRPISELQLTAGQVISQIVERMGARIYLHEGSWCIDQPANFAAPAITTRVYYKSGTLKYQIYNEPRNQQSNSNNNRRIGGGLTRFFRPLSMASTEFAARLNLNLARLRAPGGDVAVELMPAGPNFRLSARGFASTERRDIQLFSPPVGSGSPPPAIIFGIAVYRVEIFIDDLNGTFYYLNNGNPDAGGNRFYWRPTQPQWSTTQSYFWVFDTSFTQTGVNRNSLEFNIVTPPIPAVGRLRYNADFFSILGPSGIYVSSEIANVQFITKVIDDEVYLLDDSAVDNNTIVYEATDVNGKLSTYQTDLMLIGDSPLILSPGSLLNQGGPNNTLRPTAGWRRDPEAAYNNIGILHAREILEGQRQAIQKIDAWFIQDAPAPINLRKRLTRGGKAYIFNGVKLIAANDEWDGTWFEVATISGGVIVNGRPKPPFDPSRVVISDVTPGEDIQLQSSTQQQFTFQLLNHFSVTTIAADIAAGAITSIPIEPLGEAFLQTGDRLIIIDQSNGQLHELILTAPVAANDAAIAVQSVNLPNIQLGSSIATAGRRLARMIKKIDSGTLAGLVITDDQLGAINQPISINTQTGDIKSEGNFEVDEITAQDVTAQEVVATELLKVGETVTIDAENGDASFDGQVVAHTAQVLQEINVGGGEVLINAEGVESNAPIKGTDVIALESLKAGNKATIDAATGNASFDGDVDSRDVVASREIKAGEKAILDATTGNLITEGEVTAAKVQAADISSDGDVSVGRFLEVSDTATFSGAVVANGLQVGFTENNRLYLESDDAGAFFVKIKID